MNWEEPFDDTLEILEAYDTTVIQVQKQGTVTVEGKPPKMTHQFIKLDRDIADSGGDEWVTQIMKGEVNGRLYRALWKTIERWLRYIRKDGESIGLARAIELVDNHDKWQGPADPGYDDLVKAINTFEAEFNSACKEIIELRRKIRAEGERNFFYENTLYPACAKASQQLLSLRAIFRDYRPMVEAPGEPPLEHQQERQRLLDILKEDVCRNLDEPTRPRELEVVCVSIGTVCPAVVPKDELAKQLQDCGIKEVEGKTLKLNDPMIFKAAMSICISYGWRAVLDERCFLCEEDGLAWAYDRYKENQLMFGFKLDRAANACGNSGWDFMSGNIGFKPRRKHA